MALRRPPQCETEYRRRGGPTAENTCKCGCSHRHNFIVSSDLWPGAEDEVSSTVDQKPLVLSNPTCWFTAIKLFFRRWEATK